MSVATSPENQPATLSTNPSNTQPQPIPVATCHPSWSNPEPTAAIPQLSSSTPPNISPFIQSTSLSLPSSASASASNSSTSSQSRINLLSKLSSSYVPSSAQPVITHPPYRPNPLLPSSPSPPSHLLSDPPSPPHRLQTPSTTISSPEALSPLGVPQPIYANAINPAFRSARRMALEEIQPVGSFPTSPSALEAGKTPSKPHDKLEHGLEKPRLDDLSTYPGRPVGLHPLSIPPLTIKQKLYIILPQMIGAAIIDFGANFGIGCAMYLNATSVKVWVLSENTVAGDMAITIFIQGVLTFCIASGMVHVDLRNNKISAFPYPWPDTAWGTAAKKDPNATRSPLVRWWRKFNNDQGFSRGLHFFSGSDVNDIFDRRLTWRQFFRRLSWSLWKGSVLSVIYFFILWPISVAIVAPIWEHKNLAGTYTAPLIKGVYGAVYGLIQNPICAMIAMGSEDSVRHHRAERQRQIFENPEKSAMTTTAAERVSMVAGRNSVMIEDRRSSGRLLLLDQHKPGPKAAVTRTTSTTRRVDSLRRSLDGVAQHAQALALSASSPPSPTEHQGVGLGWRSTDVHRRRSLEAPRTRNRYDSQTPTRSSTITATTRSRRNSSDHSPSELDDSGESLDQTASHSRRLVPMRRLTEASIVFEPNQPTDQA